MRLLVKITEDTAQAAVMQHLFRGGEKLNAKTFKELVRGFVASYGESYNDNFFSDYSKHQEESERIVNKYYKH